MPSQLTDRQVSALRARAALQKTRRTPPARWWSRGVSDAQSALAKILDAHPNEHGELYNALRAFLAEGPAWDGQDYYDGSQNVHSDVGFVLDGDRHTIAELLATLDTATEGT